MKKITIIKSLSFLCFVFLFSTTSSGQNTALSFDGTDGQGGTSPSGQYIETAKMIPWNQSFTLMATIKLNPSEEDSNIFVWGCISVNNSAALQITADFKVRFKLGNGTTVDSDTSVGSGWHHIALTRENNDIKLYIDGFNVGFGNIDLSSILPSISTFGTGKFNGFWEGHASLAIDEFSVWLLPLSQAQIIQYRDTPPVGNELGLLVAFNFNAAGIQPGGDNSAITEISDLTGNGYDASLHGFPLQGNNGNFVEVSSTTLSIDNIDANEDVKIFPNPTADFLNVSSVLDSNSYKVFNVLGAEVLSNRVSSSRTIDVRQLNKGVYFIRFENRDSLKFVKK